MNLRKYFFWAGFHFGVGISLNLLDIPIHKIELNTSITTPIN
jgi:hypothetical protein